MEVPPDFSEAPPLSKKNHPELTSAKIKLYPDE